MEAAIIAVLSATLVAAVCICGLILTRKFFKLKGKEHHAVAEPLLAVIGTLFSVLLGFLVVGTMNDYQEARTKVNQEAQYLADVFRLAQGLGEGPRLDIRNSCRKYCNAVANEEWAVMDKNQTCLSAWEAYYELWDESLSIVPSDQRESNIHQAMLEAMQGLGECRRTRFASLGSNISPSLWLVLISGCIIIVVFTYFFVIDSMVLHAVMTGLLAVSLYLIIFLLTLYDNPFSGSLKLQPTPFAVNKKLFEVPDFPVAHKSQWMAPSLKAR
jgi:hypothetical protein